MALPSQLGPAASLASSALGFAADKSWRDRIKQAAYTSPVTGTRVTFAFEDLSRTFDVRGTALDFPGVNNSYVQQTGYSSRKYPMACIFSGRNCDLLASGLEAALLEPGLGRLEHPIYGTFDALPLGAVERNDALKSASNQSIVTVTFWTSIPAIYPDESSGTTNELENALGLFNAASAAQFASNMDLASTLRKASSISTIKALLKKVKGSLQKISDSVASVRNKFGEALALVNGGLDVLIGGPLLLAQQISNLIQAPARALSGLASRLDAYARLAADIFGSEAGSPANALSSGSTLLGHQAKVANDFHTATLFAMNAVAGSVTSVIAQPITATSDGQVPIFGSRAQILSAASGIVDQFEALMAWRDDGFEALEVVANPVQQIDTGEAYVALRHLVALTVGYLLQASFSAIPERAIVIDRPRTIIDLCAELYGTVDGKIDLLVSTNNFTGDELLELKPGRRVLYYPTAA